MTESRILWLALGVFVGFVIWGERHKRFDAGAKIVDVPDEMPPDPPPTTLPDSGGFPVKSCGGGC